MNDIKYDGRKEYYIVLDTETCNHFGCPLTYDVGYVVTTSRGEVHAERSYAIIDIFRKESGLMQTAYYAEKLPEYIAGIPLKWKEAFFAAVHKQLYEDIKNYHVKAIIAHNAPFDYRAMNCTCDYLFGIEKFFDFGIPVLDSLKLSRIVLSAMPSYPVFCEKHNFLTEKRQKPQTTAEAVYAFITKTPDFKESHTGLEDVLIENQIFLYCRNKLGLNKCHELGAIDMK